MPSEVIASMRDVEFGSPRRLVADPEAEALLGAYALLHAMPGREKHPAIVTGLYEAVWDRVRELGPGAVVEAGGLRATRPIAHDFRIWHSAPAPDRLTPEQAANVAQYCFDPAILDEEPK